MKDLSHYDKSINKNTNSQKKNDSMRYSNKQNKQANQILNGYLNDNGLGDDGGNLNKSSASHKKDNSYMSQKEF